MSNPRILKHPGLQPLWESLERERRQQQVVAIGLMIGGILLAIGSVVMRATWLPLVGGALSVAALWWLYRLLTVQPIVSFRRRLRDQPESIVWVYSLITERMPFGFKTTTNATLYMVDREGDIHAFDLKPDEVKLVTKTLNRALPAAEFGYSPEREMAYRGEITDFSGRRHRPPLDF
ncbi:hypothetical protein [Neolewinella agarilytica]|uniref:hypothetical protein n=1 Tax=Neolewinella agarilytica TaxID=478744 RepID=UPI00235418CF|nr:hypothetical protein [Neolewinella agarilytica]